MPTEYYAGGDRAIYARMVELNRGAFIEGRRASTRMGREHLPRRSAAHEEVLKNVKVDLKETFDNSFVDKANAAAR